MNNSSSEAVSIAIRNRIRNYYEKNNQSLYYFAKSAEVSYSTLRDFMQGKSEPKLGTLVLIADYMGISLSELVDIGHRN